MELVEPGVDFDRFYDEQFRRSLALAVSLTGDRSAAEELTQDAFTEAYRRWERISAYDDPGAWVRRVIANRSVSRWRRLGHEARGLLRLSRVTESAVTELDPVDASFWAAVQALPARQAQTVTLRYLEDMSVDEIAAVLAISAGAVKSHLHRGRAELARTLASESVHPPRFQPVSRKSVPTNPRRAAMNEHAGFDDFPGLDAIAGHAVRAQRSAVGMVPQPEIKRSRRWTPMVIGAFGVAVAVALVAVIAAHRPAPISVSGSKGTEHFVATFVPDNLPLYGASDGSDSANTVDSPVWLFGDPGDPLGPKTFGVMTEPTTAEEFDQELSSSIGTRTNVNGNAGFIVGGDSRSQSVSTGLPRMLAWRVGTKRFTLIAPNRNDAELNQLATSIDISSAVPGTNIPGIGPLGGRIVDTAIPLMLSSSTSSAVTYGAAASGDSSSAHVVVLTGRDRASSLAVLVLFGAQRTTFKGLPALSTHFEIPLDSSPQPMTVDQLSWADTAGSLVSVVMTGGDADKVRKVAEGLKTVDAKTWDALVAKSKIDHPGNSCNDPATNSAVATATLAAAPAPIAIGTVAGDTSASPPGSETIVQVGSNGGGLFPCGGGTAVAEPAIQHDPTTSPLPFGSTVEVSNLPATKVRWGPTSNASNSGSSGGSSSGSNDGWTLAVENPTSSSSSTGPASPIVQTSLSPGFSSSSDRTSDSIPAVFGIAETGLDIELMPLSLSDAEAAAYTEGLPVTRSADAPQGGYFAFGVAVPTGSPTPLHLVARDATGKVVWSGPASDSFETGSSTKSAAATTTAEGTVPPTTP